jgi:endonuclease/exonuclease/phosphatase family metal-dependent hydrolase
VLTYNILHGANTDGSNNYDKIAEIIKSVNPDLVALQEVDFKTNRTNKVDLAAEIGLRTNMFSIFGKAMDFDSGEYGVAILSKNAIISSQNTLLPFNLGNEPRTVLQILTTSASGDTISFVCSHLDYKPNSLERVEQVNKINELYSTNKYPTILAGDFNDVPNSEAINILEKFWQPTYDKSNPELTFPSNNPNRKIDYIMLNKNNNWEVLSRKVICDSVATDHCGYFVAIKLLK